jgi:FkbM family methyltransferase
MNNQLLKTLKQKIKILTGKVQPIKTEVECNHKWYGNSYGGFYVHPDFLSKDSIVYSFGIGEDISFDKAIIENYKCHVYAFDPTPKSIAWIKNQKLLPKFTFFEYGIARETGFVNFNLPKNSNHVSGSIIKHQNVNEANSISVLMKSFTDITTEIGPDHIDVLKMDIEGSEYDVIDSILSSAIEIDQILLELHERFFADGKQKTMKLFKSLKDKGYVLFAVSDSFEELSFIKKNKIR